MPEWRFIISHIIIRAVMDFEKKFLVDTNKISYRIVGEETVILNLDNGDYYGLNDVGTAVWEMIIAGKTLSEILNKLKHVYDTEENILQNDIKKLLSDLVKEGLINKSL